MDADGKNITQLTNNNYQEWYPSWSPDGQRIAFTSTRGGSWDIYVMDADGKNQTKLTNNYNNFSPSWSPDGQRIIFITDHDEDVITELLEIYVMDADGKNITQLTNNNYNELRFRLGRPTANASYSGPTATETLRSMSWMPTEKT